MLKDVSVSVFDSLEGPFELMECFCVALLPHEIAAEVASQPELQTQEDTSDDNSSDEDDEGMAHLP